MARIVLADDHLSAQVLLEDGEVATPALLEALLTCRGVTHGYSRTGLERLGDLCGPLEQVVAMGEPPIEGRPATLELTFRDEEQDWARMIETRGDYDVWSLGPVRPVRRGTVLVYRNPPLPPRAGLTVLGRLAQPAFPEDVLLRAGPGARLEPDGLSVVATLAGTPYVEEGVFGVRPLKIVTCNVTAEAEAPGFEGDLRIQGHVLAGARVRARGNVVVEGGVMGGEVQAGGTIRVRGEVRTGATLDAERHVLASSVAASTIRSKGHVVIPGGVSHADIEAYGEVLAGGGIVGGRVQAGARGLMAVLGSEEYVPTQVGIRPPVDPSHFVAVEGELAKLRATLRNLQPRVRDAERLLAAGPDAPSDRVAEAKKVLDLWKLLAHRETMLLSRKKALGVPLLTRRLRLDVLERAYPGVAIQLGAAGLVLDRLFPAGTFVDLDGALAFKARATGPGVA